MRHPKASILALAIVTILLYACAASNCPLESTVTCNYAFYDCGGLYSVTISGSVTSIGKRAFQE